MIKAMSFAEDFDDVKWKDTSSQLSLLLTVDGAPFNINNCQSLNIAIANSEGYIMSKQLDLAAVDDPNSGVIEMPLDDNIMTSLTPDIYRIEAWATIKPVMVETTPTTATLTILEDELKTHVAIFPSDGALQFEITNNLMGTTGRVVSVITMQNFEDRFQHLYDDTKNNIEKLRGPQGKSDFDLAVDNGYTGTVNDWLQTLVGPKGDKGDSAYQVWLDAGNKGDEKAFIVSLKGGKGDKGDPGTGVKIVGQADSPDKLPATANDADGYMVNGELYTFINGKWLNVGKIQGPKGDTGDSAYQTWLKAGNEGDDKAFLASLKGEKGEKGVVDTSNLVSANDFSKYENDTKKLIEDGDKNTLNEAKMYVENHGSPVSNTSMDFDWKVATKPDGLSDWYVYMCVKNGILYLTGGGSVPSYPGTLMWFPVYDITKDFPDFLKTDFANMLKVRYPVGWASSVDTTWTTQVSFDPSGIFQFQALNKGFYAFTISLTAPLFNKSSSNSNNPGDSNPGTENGSGTTPTSNILATVNKPLFKDINNSNVAPGIVKLSKALTAADSISMKFGSQPLQVNDDATIITPQADNSMVNTIGTVTATYAELTSTDGKLIYDYQQNDGMTQAQMYGYATYVRLTDSQTLEFRTVGHGNSDSLNGTVYIKVWDDYQVYPLETVELVTK
ncbi:hypothetical protein GPK34_01300 [Secundilactobacillus kimchicus]|uniref:hypothetical protein n=1 Tax=Secundilactobacillus kimchicus TaxID=528209 RepID=UPI001C027378|nr:hypothetical protein [Secundilactobacillus kimchicus]MBT9670674.1 hypothetical protein [Secundilactobacillus kimchicus]